jgi:hypothetical protein
LLVRPGFEPRGGSALAAPWASTPRTRTRSWGPWLADSACANTMGLKGCAQLFGRCGVKRRDCLALLKLATAAHMRPFCGV